jgi:hypothetical protein
MQKFGVEICFSFRDNACYTSSTNNILHSIHCPPSSHSSINCCVLLSPDIYIPCRVDCCMFLCSGDGCSGIIPLATCTQVGRAEEQRLVHLPATVVVLEESHTGGRYKHDVMMLVWEDLVVFWDVGLCAEAISLGLVLVHFLVVR